MQRGSNVFFGYKNGLVLWEAAIVPGIHRVRLDELGQNQGSSITEDIRLGTLTVTDCTPTFPTVIHAWDTVIKANCIATHTLVPF